MDVLGDDLIYLPLDVPGNAERGILEFSTPKYPYDSWHALWRDPQH
jgi:hypothetical protein